MFEQEFEQPTKPYSITPEHERDINREAHRTESHLHKWKRYFILCDVRSGVDSELIMKLYGLTPSQYKAVLRAFNKLGKDYFKRPLNQGFKYYLYSEFLCSGLSDIELCVKYSLTLAQFEEAISWAEAFNEEDHRLTGATLLNQKKPVLTEEQKEVRSLENDLKKKLPALLRGLG